MYKIYQKSHLTLLFADKGSKLSRGLFKRMNIAKKIMLGYGALLVVVFVHLTYSLSSLDQMDQINEAITKVNSPIIEVADRLADNLLSQDLYAHRLAILKDRDSFKLLQLKMKDFVQLTKEIGAVNSPFASVQELVAKGAGLPCSSGQVLWVYEVGTCSFAGTEK